jgi:hypothetical protein
LGITLAGALLRSVDAAIDLLVVLPACPLVGDVSSLLQPLVDLLVMLVGEVLRLIHEPTHDYLLGPTPLFRIPGLPAAAPRQTSLDERST